MKKIFERILLDEKLNRIYSNLNNHHIQEADMKLLKSNNTSSEKAAPVIRILHLETFDPFILVNNALKLCSAPNQHFKVLTNLEPHLPKLLGNARLYLESMVILFNALAKHTNNDVVIKFKSHEIHNKICLELITSMPQIISSPTETTFNKNLNYELFIVRKLLNKINGAFYVKHDKDLLNLIMTATFLKADETKFKYQEDSSFVRSLPKTTHANDRQVEEKPIMLDARFRNTIPSSHHIVYKKSHKLRKK